jgi:hypothetical protein
MQIAAAAINLASTNNYSRTERHSETLRISVPQFPAETAGLDQATLSSASPGGATAPVRQDEGGADGTDLQLLRMLLEKLTGHKIRIVGIETFGTAENKYAETLRQLERPAGAGGGNVGIEYTLEKSTTESEKPTSAPAASSGHRTATSGSMGPTLVFHAFSSGLRLPPAVVPLCRCSKREWGPSTLGVRRLRSPCALPTTRPWERCGAPGCMSRNPAGQALFSSWISASDPEF